MNELPRRRRADLPWHRQALLYALLAVAIVLGIGLVSFMQVTLTKAFELADPWQTFAIFVGVAITIAVYYRIAMSL